MPCRLPRWAYSTLPVAVILKRFLAPDLVFNLGIWLSSGPAILAARCCLLETDVELWFAAPAALRAGRREAALWQSEAENTTLAAISSADASRRGRSSKAGQESGIP